MKTEFRQNCTIEGQNYSLEKHKKPGTHSVPASFLFDSYFIALMLEKKIVVLEVSRAELEPLDEKMLENLNPLIIEMLENVFVNEEVVGEGHDLGTEDDNSSDSVIDGDSQELSTEEVEDDSEPVSTNDLSRKMVLKAKTKKKGRR